MRYFIYFLLFVCPFVNWAQEHREHLPLKVGDSVPDLGFKNVLNVPNSRTSLNANPDKLLLVDMWATWCTSCIASFPKSDSLVRLFGDQLHFLFLNTSKEDNEIKIKTLFNKLRTPDGNRYTFPVVWDTSGRMDKLFPHRAIPHVIWIFKSKVIAITHSYDVTAYNIKSVLSGISVRIPQKRELFEFKIGTPLLESGNGGNMSSLVSKTVFTKYLEGAPNSVGIRISEDSLTKRKFVLNSPILALYSIAYNPFPNNRLLLDDSLKEGLIRDEIADSSVKAQSYFSYELTMPINTTIEVMRQKMKKDLDQQFGLRSCIKKMWVSCYALIEIKDSTKFYRTTSLISFKSEEDWSGFTWFNKPISHFLEALNSQTPGKTLGPIVLNETGYSGNLNLALKIKKLQDIPSLKAALHPYGLDIVPVKRELDMLVISKESEKN